MEFWNYTSIIQEQVCRIVFLLGGHTKTKKRLYAKCDHRQFLWISHSANTRIYDILIEIQFQYPTISIRYRLMNLQKATSLRAKWL